MLLSNCVLQVGIPESSRSAFPQCSTCRGKGTKPKETGKSVQNAKAAKQAEAKKQKQAADQAANWAASKQKVPTRLPEWQFNCLVGCSKTSGSKIHWKFEDGTDTNKDQCTWQPKSTVPGGISNVKLVPGQLRGATIRLEVAGKIHNAALSDDGGRQPKGTTYWLEYKKKVGSRGRKKADNWLDLELPVGEKCSWWRLDGYDTWEEAESDSDSEAEPAEPNSTNDGNTEGSSSETESEEAHDYRDY